MLELSQVHGETCLASAGDTLNTAIHLARMRLPTAYLTAVGTDRFSEDMVEAWGAEGLDCRLVMRHPTRHSGLYAISVDETGERSFTYWRSESAAREMFALVQTDEYCRVAAQADLFCFSLISLAILPEEGRRALINLAGTVRAQGGSVAFDSNYRSRLWTSAEEARRWRDAAVATASIGLPTLEDELLLDPGTDAEGVARKWTALGCAEVTVKLGSAGCRIPRGLVVAPPTILRPVDTSGAGDAFNAGYLAARLAGQNPADAAAQGHERAGWTIMRPGAIPRRDA